VSWKSYIVCKSGGWKIINERTHTSNALRFWVKVWCFSRLCGWSWSNVDDPPGSPRDPTTVSEPKSDKILNNSSCQKLSWQGAQAADSIEQQQRRFKYKCMWMQKLSLKGDMYRCMWMEKLPFEGEHNKLMDSHLKMRLLCIKWKSHITWKSRSWTIYKWDDP